MSKRHEQELQAVIDELVKQLQDQKQALQQEGDRYRRELAQSRQQAAMWEKRFDRLLRVAAHEPMATTIVTHSQT